MWELTVFQTSKEDILRKRNSLLIPATLPHSAPFWSVCAREKVCWAAQAAAEKWGEPPPVSHRKNWRLGDSSGTAGLTARSVPHQRAARGMCYGHKLCDLLQEPRTPSLPSVKNWCMRNHSLKQLFLAPADFATTCLDPANKMSMKWI